MQKNRKKSFQTPSLRFSPTAWAKLLFLRDYGETEVGGFGVTAAEDLLYVEDLRVVKQTCGWASVEFDDTSVADFFDEQVDAGLRLEQFARVWIHTHPGECPLPSGTDEETFQRVFGGSDWALMFIVAQGGETYARLRFNIGPGGEAEIPVAVDFSEQFSASDHEQWEQEYLQNVGQLESKLQTRQPAELAQLTFGETFDPNFPPSFENFLDPWRDELDEEFSYYLERLAYE